ncbi:MAG: glutamine-hydrolyzing GMP synthase [Lentisphaeria bacterium]|nr:glutamine-hydrolyzing GMP synthase [Lentisphaeria bacterium]
MEKIAVLDFGGQYAHLIANRVRRLGVFTEILSPASPAEDFADYAGIIFSGGPSSVYAPDRPDFNPEILGLDQPILGICYGHQLISQTLGGAVKPGKVKEYGIANVTVEDAAHPLLIGLPASSPMWMSHGDSVNALAPGFRAIASTPDCELAAVANDARKMYGIQFHPEVTHSRFGNRLLENFIAICGCERTWSTASYLRDLEGRLRQQVGDRNVFLLVSGGVDSTVAFVLLNRLLGEDRVLGLHIDNGLMRLNESQAVKDFLNAENMRNLNVADAGDLFLSNLAGVSSPEAKRKIIGDTFLDVKDLEIEKLKLDPDHWVLAQGTIYPDTIESGGTKHADVIKTHHNRVPAIVDMLVQGKVIEPLADLYKDEVRALGEELGIPHALVWRHPFPGPGLGVRLLCSDGVAPDTTVPGLEAFLTDHGIEGQTLPIRSVGVQGDARTYAHPFVLRGAPDWDKLEAFSTALTNRFADVNRVVYQAGPRNHVAYTLVAQYCEKDKLDTLRRLDDICTAFLQEKGLYEAIWQMPVVLPPLEVDGGPAVVLRPVCSNEAMTASFYPMAPALLTELCARLLAGGAGAVLYDITHKPPATIEWE